MNTFFFCIYAGFGLFVLVLLTGAIASLFCSWHKRIEDEQQALRYLRMALFGEGK